MLTLYPRSSDPGDVAQAGGNHLDIIVRYSDDTELIKETADAFRSIGGYCLGRELKGGNVHETIVLQEEEWSLHLQRDSQYYLDKYDCVSEYDNSDAQCCLPLGIF